MIPFISLLLFTSNSFAAIPDFKTQIYHGDSDHSNLWAIEISPPSAHHFNLEAPRSAQQEKIKFELVQGSPEKILFQIEDPGLHSGSVVEVSAFLCDEKKTYCVKKKATVTLDNQKSKVISDKFSSKKELKISNKSEPKKEVELFIENDSARALKEAKKTGKPILIDFYGIWCPPCNLYNETVFNTKKFAIESKKFVLLKMDADDEKSWVLKSKFKIGGYPTLLIAKVDDDGTIEEIERIVGYLPPEEFFPRLNVAYQHRNDIPEFRWKGRFEERLTSLLDQKNYDELIRLTAASKEAKIKLYRFIAQTKKLPDFIKDPKNITLVKESIESIAKDVETQTSNTLMHAVDFLNDEFWLKQDQFNKIANEFIDQLEKRIDPNTMFVKESELTAADLDSMRMDLAETLSNEKMVNEIRKKAITHYEKLITFLADHGSKDLRSMNLEYAFLLWKDGRVDQAKKIYQQFIQKYPAEFTFYYAASKMYLILKDYPHARENAEKAVQFSYGDNRIRSMERLITIMAEQGLKTEAISKGKEFLKTVKIPQGLDVRTGRYIDSLKTVIANVEKTKEGKK